MSNLLLLDLPHEETAKLNAQLIITPLVTRQIVLVRGERVSDVYFVDSGIVSLTVGTNNGNGNECEVGLIGYEGAVGVSAFLNTNSVMIYQGLVQAAGNAMRLTAASAHVLMQTCPTFSARCHRYIDSLMNQTAQVAGCNVRHTMQERMARWLLMTQDRLHSDNLPLTQDFLAIMLGAGRSTVALTINTLQAAGLIRQERGRIVIIDQKGLQSVACDCYRIVHELYDFDQRQEFEVTV